MIAEVNAAGHPIEPWGQKRIGDWIQTRCGVRLHILDTRPEDFKIEDIAHALSNQCRFAGHTRTFYSVAEHSVRVALAVEAKLIVHPVTEAFLEMGMLDHEFIRQLCYSALMHDASDAYMLDMPRPFKYLPEFKVYKDIEHDVMSKMASAMNFSYPKPSVVGWADNVLLGTEARDLFSFNLDNWNDRYEKLPGKIRPWSPAKAKRRFLDLYYKLNQTGDKAPRFWFIKKWFL